MRKLAEKLTGLSKHSLAIVINVGVSTIVCSVVYLSLMLLGIFFHNQSADVLSLAVVPFLILLGSLIYNLSFLFPATFMAEKYCQQKQKINPFWQIPITCFALFGWTLCVLLLISFFENKAIQLTATLMESLTLYLVLSFPLVLYWWTLRHHGQLKKVIVAKIHS